MEDHRRPVDTAKTKRPRGRPKGSGPYRDGDLAALSIFADKQIQAPGAQLAPFLAKRGYEAVAIRRAQAVWREFREQMIAEAQLRFDSRPPESLAQVILNVVAGLQHLGKAVVDSDFGRNLTASMARARTRQKALEVLNRPSDLPFDVTSASALAAAVARSEREMLLPDSPELRARFANRTLGDLTLSERTYLMAIVLHALSLEQLQSEIDAAQAKSDSPPNLKGRDRQ